MERAYSQTVIVFNFSELSALSFVIDSNAIE